MHAVHKNQAGAARALIGGGAAVDALGPHNETALMMAAGYGQEEMVKLLLKAGADAATARAGADGGNTGDCKRSAVPRCGRRRRARGPGVLDGAPARRRRCAWVRGTGCEPEGRVCGANAAAAACCFSGGEVDHDW